MKNLETNQKINLRKLEKFNEYETPANGELIQSE